MSCMHNRLNRLFGGTVCMHHAIRLNHTEIRCRQSRMQAPVARFRGPIVRTNRKHPLRPMSMFLLLVLLISLVTAGCGNYSSQAEKYLTQARSQVLGSAYTLEQLGEGELRPDEPSTVYLGHAENRANP